MAELIGTVFTLPGNTTLSKEHILMFDQIACFPGTLTGDPLHTEPAAEESADNRTLRWLLERGLLLQPSWGEGIRRELREEARRFREARTAIPTWPQTVPESSRIQELEAAINWAQDAAARALAVKLRQADGLDAVPITRSWATEPDMVADRSHVVQIVVKSLPIPGDNHSLDDILAFRDEARADGLILGLRVWINEMASGKLTNVHVSDKLEDLVNRYERALQLEKMRRSTGIVETLVVTTAEIAESLVKFRWSALAKKLFEVRHREIDLMKAEMTLPGREVAYIVKARERFGE